MTCRQETRAERGADSQSASSPGDAAHQHPSASESHHAQPALEHEAFQVGGGDLGFVGFGAVGPVGLLGLSVRIVHALHVFPQLILPLVGETLVINDLVSGNKASC